MACGRLYKLDGRRTVNNDNCSAALGQKWPQKQSQSISFEKNFPWGAYPQTPPSMCVLFAPPISNVFRRKVYNK